ncbi:hypothetical protein [Xanthomonas axonopodis]|uniref:hypothetical protein n=1 Tax=Xanthomonas axonopodis TaxID=53413 RepID=UPI001482BCD1|nr:hypothetical protein [Xanthomonas axonopodis]
MNTHDETSGGMPIQPMSSGYYWFQDPYGSPVEIVDVDVGFSRHTYKNNSQNPISFVKT